MTPGRAERGFTLVELMVVVAIIGVFATAAAVTVRTEPDLATVAGRIGAQVSEASRKAISGGPVRANVVQGEGYTARARLYVGSDDAGQFVSVDVRVEEEPEDAATSQWWEVSRTYLPDEIEVYGYELEKARLTPEGDPTPLGTDAVMVECEPNGSCQAATLYLQSEGEGAERKRVVVMPLGHAPRVFDGW